MQLAPVLLPVVASLSLRQPSSVPMSDQVLRISRRPLDVFLTPLLSLVPFFCPSRVDFHAHSPPHSQKRIVFHLNQKEYFVESEDANATQTFLVYQNENVDEVCLHPKIRSPKGS